MRSLHTADWPYLYVPGHFPRIRHEEDASEVWLGRVAPEAFVGVHSVIDVAPGGRTYRLMLVDARDERGTVLGAYDFTTSTKTKPFALANSKTRRNAIGNIGTHCRF